MYEYECEGTCSTKVRFDIRGGRIYDVSFEDGCDGNLKALSILAEGMDIDELCTRLRDVQCEDRGTSCAGQLVRGVERWRGKSSGAAARPA